MDIGDKAQQLQAAEIDRALAEQARKRSSAGVGPRVCTEPGCDEPIAPARRAFGAVRCVACQGEHEHRAAQWARTQG